MRTKILILTVLFGVTIAAACSAGDAKLEQALRDLDSQWSKAAAAKDVDKTISFYSHDATVLPANAPVANTKEAIRKVWQDLLTTPGLAISWKTSKVEVAKSGDLACATGTYEMTVNDASGKPVNDHGKYVVVWEKQRDGNWKCGTDIWNSDLPAPPAAASPATSQ
jgi:uncharacterized protein (TIGR02246 family)